MVEAFMFRLFFTRMSANSSALARWGKIDFFTAAGAAAAAATGHLIDGGPSPPFGLLRFGSTLFIAPLDVLGLAFLSVRIT